MIRNKQSKGRRRNLPSSFIYEVQISVVMSINSWCSYLIYKITKLPKGIDKISRNAYNNIQNTTLEVFTYEDYS